MKSIIILFVLILSSYSFAQNQTTATELLDISQRVQSKIEYDLWNMSDEQRSQVAKRLLAVERLLSNGGGTGALGVACIRHSNSYLGFALTKLSNNQKISISMALNECQNLLLTKKNSIICTKSTQSYLGYTPYNIQTDISYGIGASLNDCSVIAQSNNKGMLCAKASVSYNGYRLTRIFDGGTLGGFYNLTQCLFQLQ